MRGVFSIKWFITKQQTMNLANCENMMECVGKAEVLRSWAASLCTCENCKEFFF